MGSNIIESRQKANFPILDMTWLTISSISYLSTQVTHILQNILSTDSEMTSFPFFYL